MKKITIVLISLSLFCNIHLYSQENQSNSYFDSTNFKDISIQESTNFIKQNALLIAAVPTLIYFNQSVLQTISEHPYISSICFYVLINYICDAILDYKEQESLIHLILLLKKITLYIAMSHGIKNYMNQKKQPAELLLKEQSFFNDITKKWPYSFDKMTIIILESYKELKKHLYRLNKSIHVESEEFVFLQHASSITIDDLSYLTQDNESLHAMICRFEKSPELEIEELLEHLTFQITLNFLALEQSLLKFQIAAINKQQAIL